MCIFCYYNEPLSELISVAQCLLSFDFRSTLPIEKEKEKTKSSFKRTKSNKKKKKMMMSSVSFLFAEKREMGCITSC
ncbi:hypothetical protein OUZ56_015872 [Daphnia magna]|uniref:Uncharacterized protein n=1 Tax=Daphnia magna TaxID=35525 RepID=A0ABR0AP29_9CRUS|nr:hypothetical protein OUZ56_015872 [Daphnia magna]